MNLSPIPSRHNSIDQSINAEYTKQLEKQKSSALAKKIGDVVYEILGYTPVFGTFIGIHHAYKAHTQKEKVEGWEKFQIFTQLFSFLVIPQIIYGIACAVDAIHTKRQEEKAARAELMNALDSAIKATGDLGNTFEAIGQAQAKIQTDILNDFDLEKK